MSFFQRILGAFRQEAHPSTNTPPRAGAVKPVAPPPLAEPPQPVVALSWQEMLDSASRIAGYVLRPGTAAPADEISGRQLIDALAGAGIARLASRRQVVVPVTAGQWRGADFPGLAAGLASGSAWFLLAATAELPGGGWGGLASEIQAAGGRVAADREVFLELAETGGLPGLLLLDMRGASLANFEHFLRGLRQQHPSLLIAVEGVASWAEYRLLMSLGVDFCVGSFAAAPDEAEQAEGISQGRLVVIEMLNLLRQEADIGDIAAVAKRDPGVVLKLIEMANSPLSGLARQVVALEDAIMLLGREALYRWLALALFRVDARGSRDESLLVIALSRAAFLESLAPGGDRQRAGELFLVGLFSLIDSLLQLPIRRVLEKVQLPAPVAEVLLENAGPYARYLMLALAMERCRVDQAVSLAIQLELDPPAMVASYGESMAWATSDLLS